MTKRAAFTADDIARAIKGGEKAGVRVSILIRPDGTMLVLPSADASVVDVGADLEARLARFAGS